MATITNRHYLNQFALRLLSSTIKSGKVDISSSSSVFAKVDGLIALLVDMLDSSRHSEECCLVFRLFHRLVKQPDFANLRDRKLFKILVEKYFAILKSHCRGTSSKSNADLVAAAFKAVTTLIDSAYGECLSDAHLTVLLGYAEEDLYNTDRQATAFPLLQALLKRKNICEEMEHVGRKVLKLAVQADSEAGRNAARNYFVNFLLEVQHFYLHVQISDNT